MRKNPFFGTLLFSALLLASCQKEARLTTAGEASASEQAASAKAGKPAAHHVAHSPESDLLKAVRSATARFHSTNQAEMAGYLSSNHCVSVPGLGGMGYHWANPTLVDAEFDPLQPEAVLYATAPNGKLRLIAVEYIVLKEPGMAWPMFGDQAFDDGGTPDPRPHWSLHVWLYENNPAGMFTPFNPNITCP
ncbi:hypothetical protein HRH25_02510 [Flavisolibacter sp. BT320]|nr:hypothetical protein [Flavisolibacter longurius]